MATTNQRIRYDLEAAVSGQEDVAALARQLEGLADTLEGDLKTQAQASAQALRELGAKQGAVENFTALKREVSDASDKLAEAQLAAQKLGRELAATNAPTRAQVGQMQKLRDTVRDAKAEVISKTAALDRSRSALRTYGIDSANAAQAERNLRAATAAARAEVAAMAPAYRQAGQQAAASARQQVTSNQQVSGSLSELGDQLRAVQRVAIAAIGGTFAGQLVGDLNESAEAFTSVADRIRLVTGEGAPFEAAFRGVQQVALETNSALEGTGTLFARIQQAGENLGRTNEQSLAVTKTINQAVQIAGGSAQSSNAALVQLIQGLQSGVLRGEEFNSVMEQSPRLAQALADGLGKTVGELRELAQQGALTSEVVIGALEGQAEAINTEFEKITDRPSRALQNMSTAWQVYLGNADKATGSSQLAAQAINALAENLDTIIGLLLDAGQAVSAFVALRLAQQFLGIGAAAQTAAVQVAASTTAINAASASAVTAGANVGRLASILGGLKTLSLLGVVTNIQDIGTWLGESAAKLAGYKDLTEELAREERIAAEISAENARQKAAMAQATQLAIEASRGLTPEARALTGEFDKMQASGKSAGDALAELSKKANLQDTTGIQAYSIALRDLAVQGKASADQIREAMANALKGEDLAQFEVMARTALAGTRDEAELLAIALDASLREAINRSGADFATISGGMSKAATSAVNDTELIIQNLDRLASQGVDTAAALTASLGKGIQTADSQAALNAVREQIEAVRDVLGEQVADGLLDQLGEQANRVTKEVGGLQSALSQLGITSDADLKKAADAAKNLYERVREGGGSAREQAEAFQKMADAAIRSGDSTAIAYAKSQAAANRFEVAVDSAGRTVVRRMGEAAKATEGYRGSIQNATEEVQQHIGWLDRMIERNNKVKSSMKTDGEGFAADASGNRVVAGGDLNTLTGIAAFLKANGVEDEATARRIALEFSNGKGEIPYFSNPGQKRYGGDTISMALLRAAERVTFAGYGVGGAQVPGVETSIPKQAPREVNVNLNVNGKSYGTVNTDAEGAERIVNALNAAKAAAGV